jgi:hypothetical protein
MFPPFYAESGSWGQQLYAQLFSIRFYVGQDSIGGLDGVFFHVQYTAG